MRRYFRIFISVFFLNCVDVASAIDGLIGVDFTTAMENRETERFFELLEEAWQLLRTKKGCKTLLGLA